MWLLRFAALFWLRIDGRFRLDGFLSLLFFRLVRVGLGGGFDFLAFTFAFAVQLVLIFRFGHGRDLFFAQSESIIFAHHFCSSYRYGFTIG